MRPSPTRGAARWGRVSEYGAHLLDLSGSAPSLADHSEDLALVPLELPAEQRSRAFDDPAVLEGAYTEASVRDALVLQVDDDASDRARGHRHRRPTVAVPDPAASLRIAHAVNAGGVTVVRMTGTSRDGNLPTRYRPDSPAGQP